MIAPVGLSAVLVVALRRHVPGGHEQEGTRPAIVVGVPEHVGTPRFRAIVVVPPTTQAGDWADRRPALYPRLPAGSGNLPSDSVVLLANLRSVDADPVLRRLGALTEDALAPIRSGINAIVASGPAAPGTASSTP